MGWWGLTFPFGVFILALFNLGHQIEVVFLQYVAVAFSILLLVMWSVVIEENLSRSIQWQPFFSPCLVALQQRMQVAEKVQKAFAPDLYLLSNFVNLI